MPARSEGSLGLLLSCEHGGNGVPARWRKLFQGAEGALASHRGWDPGALALARALSRRLGAPLVSTTVSRLLVETNRSLSHPRLFSEITRVLPPEERDELVARYWKPHRGRVQALASEVLRRAGRVLHLGVHSFTPVLGGKVRTVDVGLLYDPRRKGERAFCRDWIQRLRARLPELRVRANQPYQGASDGLTTELRQLLGTRYLGVELEVGQALLAAQATGRRRLVSALADTLAESLAAANQRVPAKPASAPASAATAAAAGKRTRPTRGW